MTNSINMNKLLILLLLALLSFSVKAVTSDDGLLLNIVSTYSGEKTVSEDGGTLLLPYYADEIRISVNPHTTYEVEYSVNIDGNTFLLPYSSGEIDSYQELIVIPYTDNLSSGIREGRIIIKNTESDEENIFDLEQSSIGEYTSVTEGFNTVQTTSYWDNGRITGQSIQYIDGLGKPLQSVSRNISSGNTMVSQPLYDNAGRVNITTMTIPVYDDYQLDYRPDFIDYGGYYYSKDSPEPYAPTTNYSYTKVEYSDNIPGAIRKASVVGKSIEDVYTSSFTVNVSEDEITSLPIGKYLDLNTLKIGGENSANYKGMTKTVSKDVEGKEYITYYSAEGNPLSSCISHCDPWLEKKEFNFYFEREYMPHMYELSFSYWYTVLHYEINLNTGLYSSVDIRGYLIDKLQNDRVIYENIYASNPYDIYYIVEQLFYGALTETRIADINEKFRIQAIYETNSDIEFGNFNYIDFHLPAMCTGITYDITKKGDWTSTLINLETDAEVNSLLGVSPGFYRMIYYPDPDYVRFTEISFSYEAGYSYHSFTGYDEAGRVTASLSPKAAELIGAANNVQEAQTLFNNYASKNTYNTLGWLLTSYSHDEGLTEYIYRQDGKIRYSQNAEQKSKNTFSYTNYDEHGRILEVGECYNAYGMIYGKDIEAEFSADNYGFGSTHGSSRTYTYYDLPDDNIDIEQNFVRGKVSRTWNDNTSTWYSYTYRGEVKTVVQEITGLDIDNDGIANNTLTDGIEDAGDLITVNYEYDFGGNVTKVTYNADREFTHFYEYDLNGRLSLVYTKNNYEAKVLQARYIYYPHGPLKRVELAENLQGIDYVYTIEGWLKSINHASLDDRDPGKDGIAGKANQNFKPDLFGMTLDYYSGDYVREGTSIVSVPQTSRYDGLITQMRWRNRHFDSNMPYYDQNIYRYSYDKRNYLSSAIYGNTFSEVEKTGFFGNAYSVLDMTYDANGNIELLKRLNDKGYAKDLLSYHYSEGKLNQLNNVRDMAGDGEDQITGNYTYNKIGQMTGNAQASHYFTYDVYGKTNNIYSNEGHTNLVAEYKYDDRGFRVKKNDKKNGVTTWYIRDISGNILSVYGETGSTDLICSELPLYGSGRLGVAYCSADNEISKYAYEISDHLGNVRAVMSKERSSLIEALTFENKLVNINTIAEATKRIVMKPGFSTNGKNFSAVIVAANQEEAEPELISATDYYPGGMVMPGRNYTLENYRFGYQGQFAEKDEETGYSQFELRLYDARIGRWMCPDPYSQYNSTYVGMGNNWVNGVDPDGGFFGEFRATVNSWFNKGSSVYESGNGNFYTKYSDGSFSKSYGGSWFNGKTGLSGINTSISVGPIGVGGNFDEAPIFNFKDFFITHPRKDRGYYGKSSMSNLAVRLRESKLDGKNNGNKVPKALQVVVGINPIISVANGSSVIINSFINKSWYGDNLFGENQHAAAGASQVFTPFIGGESMLQFPRDIIINETVDYVTKP